LCFVKRVPDTGVPIKVKDDGKGLALEGIPFVMNPYDEYAVEAALKVKEKLGEAEVVLCAVGDDSYGETIRHGLAMGADRGILVKVSEPMSIDGIQVAKLLLEVVEKENPDIIFCGKKAVDDERSYVHAYVACKRDIPYLYGAVNISFENGKVAVTKETEGGLGIFELPVPCMVSFDKCQFEPRYPSLKGIMMAKKKKIDVIEPGNMGEKMVEVLGYEPPPPKQPGKIIDLPFPDNVKELVRLLKEEAKVL
jgi:electron transfer flavoprotein beta subunit